MKQIGWHRFRVLLTLVGLFFGMILPSSSVRAQVAERPLALHGDMDICEQGEGTGKITGRVTRATDGSPIEGARVYHETVYENRYIFSTPTFTDADGNYEFSEVAGGSYVVYADANAINRDAGDRPALLEQVYDGQATMATFTPVQVVDGATVANVNFNLIEGGKIAGRITQEENDELKGTIILYDATIQNTSLATLSPGANGHYTITQGLAPGGYKLSFRLWGGSETIYYPNTTNFDEAQVIEIVGTETVIANIHLPKATPVTEVPTGEIRGKVTLPNAGNPKDIVRVKAFVGDNVFESASASPDANGLYTLTVPAGNIRLGTEPWYGLEVGGPNPLEYVVTFYNGKKNLAEAETIVVAADEVIEDIHIALAKGSHISGRVTYANGGGPVAGATVSAFTGLSINRVSQSAVTTADLSGYYTLPALAQGVYTVTATVGPFDECSYPRHIYPTKVELNGADPVPNINFAMAKGAFITGRVTDDDSGAGVVLSVRALLDDEEEIRPFNFIQSARTGHFRLGPLLPGEYTLSFVPPDSTGLRHAYYNDSANGTVDRSASRTFSLVADEIITDIHIALLAAPDEPEEPTDPDDPDDPDSPTNLYMPSLGR